MVHPLARIMAWLGLVFLLGCPPSPFPESSRPTVDAPLQGHSFGVSGVQLYAESGATGLWFVQTSGASWLLTGNARGLNLRRFSGEVPDYSGTTIDGPTTSSASLQRDVEVFLDHAFVCSTARGFREGVMILDLRNPQAPAYVGSFQPQDGNPEAANLSIDVAGGRLYLARSTGVEVWDLSPDPTHPRFLGLVAAGVPVADLSVQGDRLYLAEGASKSFSVWSVAVPGEAVLMTRWNAGAFANSIWPSADGTLVGTVQEDPVGPIAFHALSATGQMTSLSRLGQDLGGRPVGIKLWRSKSGDPCASVSAGSGGWAAYSLKDPSHPLALARYDGPIGQALVSNVWDSVVFSTSGNYPRVALTDRQQGLFLMQITAP